MKRYFQMKFNGLTKHFKYSELEKVFIKFSKIISIFLLVGINLMCKPTHNKSAEQDDILLTEFNEDEIKWIDKLVEVFDAMVLAGTSSDDINDAYQVYFYRNDTSELQLLVADFNKAENISRIKGAIQDLKATKLFNDFWIIREGTRRTIDPETLSYIDEPIFELGINLDGRFIQVLRAAPDSNEVFENYYTSLLIENGIGPGLIAQIMKGDYKDIDFSLKFNRLVWSVHYISVLTPMEPELYDQLIDKTR